METAFMIIAILWALSFACSFIYDNKLFFDFLLCFLSGAVIGSLIMIICNKSEPAALDVYQNKTTLEITYRDSIPVDSIVIFKYK